MKPLAHMALEHPVYGLDVLSDNRIVISGGGGRMKSGIPNLINTYRFSPDGQSFEFCERVQVRDVPVSLASFESSITAVIDKGIKIFHFKDKSFQAECDYEYDAQIARDKQVVLSVSPNGIYLAIGSESGALTVLERKSLRRVSTFKLHTASVLNVTIDPQSSQAVSVSRDKSTFLWALKNGDLIQKFKAVSAGMHVRCACFPRTKRNMLFLGETGRKSGACVSLWRLSDDKQPLYYNVSCVKATRHALTALCVSDDGRYVAISSTEGHVCLMRVKSTTFVKLWSTEGTWSRGVSPHVLPVTCMRISANQEILFTGSADYTVNAWKVQPASSSRHIVSFVTTVVIVFLILGAILSRVPAIHHLANMKSRVPLKLSGTEQYSSDDLIGKKPAEDEGKPSRELLQSPLHGYLEVTEHRNTEIPEAVQFSPVKAAKPRKCGDAESKNNLLYSLDLIRGAKDLCKKVSPEAEEFAEFQVATSLKGSKEENANAAGRRQVSGPDMSQERKEMEPGYAGLISNDSVLERLDQDQGRRSLGKSSTIGVSDSLHQKEDSWFDASAIPTLTRDKDKWVPHPDWHSEPLRKQSRCKRIQDILKRGPRVQVERTTNPSISYPVDDPFVMNLFANRCSRELEGHAMSNAYVETNLLTRIIRSVGDVRAQRIVMDAEPLPSRPVSCAQSPADLKAWCKNGGVLLLRRLLCGDNNIYLSKRHTSASAKTKASLKPERRPITKRKPTDILNPGRIEEIASSTKLQLNKSSLESESTRVPRNQSICSRPIFKLDKIT